MVNESNNDVRILSEEERIRSTPKTGAEQTATKRERSSELPAKEESRKNLQDRIEAANETANQTIGDGNEHEVQGKAAVPHAKVMKRGSTKWVDDDGVFHKELNDAEVNAPIAERERPDYLQLHQEVLEGAEPIKATLAYQDRDADEAFAEGKLEDAEKHPRTGGIGAAAARPENRQKADK